MNNYRALVHIERNTSLILKGIYEHYNRRKMSSKSSEANLTLYIVWRHKAKTINKKCWSCEDQRSDRAMPFLDILITPGRDGSLSTSVYRKPTHTDLYLQLDSQHTLTSKYNVIGTLQHRAQTICSNPQLLLKEEQHLKSALKKCKNPTWALNKIQIKSKKQDTKQSSNQEN